MKKLLLGLIALTVLPATLLGQNMSNLHMEEIAEVDNGESTLYVIFKPTDGQNCYYLNLGALGSGDKVIQMVLNPVYQLFIPLGATLDETIDTLEDLKEFYQEEVGTSKEMDAYYGLIPDNSRQEVTVSVYKSFLCRKLMFALQRDGYIDATYLSKSDLSSLLRGVKWHKKLYPNK